MDWIKKTGIASTAVPVITDYIFPIIRIIFTTTNHAVGTGVAAAAGHLVNKFTGSIFETVDEVVRRTCADLEMSVHFISNERPGAREKMKLLASGMCELYNTLTMDGFRNGEIPDNMIDFMSAKFMPAMMQVARMRNVVLRALETPDHFSDSNEPDRFSDALEPQNFQDAREKSI